MGYERVGAGHDVWTMIGGAVKENGDGRHVNDVWEKGRVLSRRIVFRPATG